MGLIGALSNHGVRGGLAELTDALARSSSQPLRLPGSGYQRIRPGMILDGVVKVLATSDQPLSPKQVHVQLEARLGLRVQWSSVKQALSGNLAGQSNGRACFERVARGRYRLAPS